MPVVPRRIAGAAFSEEWQRLREDGLYLNLNTRPKGVSEFWVSNKFQRTLANLVGVVQGKCELLEATPGRALRVHPDASDNYAASRGTAADAWGGDLWSGLGAVIHRVLVRAWTNDLEIEFLPVGASAFDESIRVVAGDPHLEILGLYTQCKVQNYSAGNNSGYQVVGFYSN